MASTKRIIMITGGTGLVGKGVQLYLQDHPSSDTYIYLSSKDGDLRNLDETKAIFVKYQPTHVIHLAALVGGLYKNMRCKLQFFRDNMAINDNVLRCCFEYKVEKCISCLSTCIFPDQRSGEIKDSFPDDISNLLTEDVIHNGPPHPSNEGYAYAKRMLDVMNRLYHEERGCKFTSVIPTNIFGPYDNFSLEDGHVLPGLIHRCYDAKMNNKEFVVWGSGKPLRQFIYSLDLGSLLVWCLDHYDDINPIILSVGEEDEISIQEAAKEIKDAMNFDGPLTFDTSRDDGQGKKTASNKKIRTLYTEFKFTPFKEAIQATVNWFINNYEMARK